MHLRDVLIFLGLTSVVFLSFGYLAAAVWVYHRAAEHDSRILLILGAHIPLTTLASCNQFHIA